MMMPPKNAKKIEVCGVTFYALRQIIGYIGSGNWGSAQNFVEKHGWNLYNSKGAFIMEVKQELLGSLLSSELLPK
jgi:hypothetical protein